MTEVHRWRYEVYRENGRHKGKTDRKLRGEEAELQRQINDEIFRIWLTNKAYEQKELKRAKRLEEARMTELARKEGELKKQLNELSRTNWLRKKNAEIKAQKEKELKESQTKVVEEGRKIRRRIQSEEKLNEWMKKTKNRPKPVTQAISGDSLANVRFVNPVPWKGTY